MRLEPCGGPILRDALLRSAPQDEATCHLVTPAGHPGDAFLRRVAHDLHRRFDIEHATLQIEVGDSDECPLRCKSNV